jgi:glutaconate CoA-transferase subunit A
MALKQLSLEQAIDRFVPDGASVAIGMALESLIPFAAGHELVRQRRRDLELIGPISDMLFDQLIGAGCVRRNTAAWVGNLIGIGANYLDPSHTTRHAGPHRAVREVEVM